MSYFNREEVIVTRDCPAVTVPFGTPVTIEEGCKAVITQQLGSSYTVVVEGNMYRIEGVDADAIGKDLIEIEPFVPEQPATEETVEEACWVVLTEVFDPEIPVDIVNLGLVYRCNVSQEGPDDFHVQIDMTLTAPGCGMGTFIAEEARSKVLNIQGVSQAHVDLVWDPPWSREMMSESARLQLGML